MSKLYNYYQLEGGTEEWKPIHTATMNLAELRPALVTVLACDRLLSKDSSKEMIADARYWGPMYFDLDNEDDLEGCIRDARHLVNKLTTEYGVTSGIEIYLSGKKGIHVLIDPRVFIDGRPTPISKLFAIYKEIAFKLATSSTDFAVYSGRSGRMLRTCYVQRDNGKWRVRISSDTLNTLTAQEYSSLCDTFNPGVPEETVVFAPKLALLYEGIAQKVGAQKKVKTKPVDAATLRRDKPTVLKLMRGEGIKDGVGFNKIAMQLGLYAHEAKMTREEFIEQCAGLVANHESDGYRYNTATKRKRELGRMFDYLEEGVGYDYSVGPIKALLESPKPIDEFNEESPVGDEDVVEDASGLFVRGSNYYVATEQGEKHILDAVFKDTTVLLSTMDERIVCISATLVRNGKKMPCTLELGDLSSSNALHRVVSGYGAAFTGTDIYARNIYSYMLREAESGGRTAYVTDREGLDVLKLPLSDNELLRAPFVVWSDRFGVRLPPRLQDAGIDIRFVGYPQAEGVMKTDLATTPSYADWKEADPHNEERMLLLVRGLLKCQDAATLSKMIGWMVACFYKQLFQEAYGKFPLLHVNGAAGSGKSELTEGLMHLFYNNGEPVILSPSSTNFAIVSSIASSASIPVIVDEYKPHVMNRDTLNNLRGIFRSAYNGHMVSRGGGTRGKDAFNALNQTVLAAPVAFIAEAIESETAILERSVLISLKRPFGRLMTRYAPHWFAFRDNRRLLAVLGQTFAAAISAHYSVDQLRKEFDPILAEATGLHMIKPGDYETLRPTDLAKKELGKSRVIYNYCVAQFGLSKLKELLKAILPTHTSEWDELFKPLFEDMFVRMDEVNENAMAEYLKVFTAFSDMTRLPQDDPNRLTHGVDYELATQGGTTTLNIIARLAYSKYKRVCRSTGDNPLFPNDLSFQHALKDAPVFMMREKGTRGLQQESVVLDYDGLVRLGVERFSKD